MDSTGAPIHGTVSVGVEWRDGPTRSALVLGQQSFEDVAVQDGYLSLVLDVDTAVLGNEEVWLQYSIDGVPLGHSKRLSRAPLSAVADIARGVAEFEPGQVCESVGQLRFDDRSRSLMACSSLGWTAVGAAASPTTLQRGIRNPDGSTEASCLDYYNGLPAASDGVYALQGAGYSAPVIAYCDMTGGGWTVIRSESSRADGDISNWSVFTRRVSVPAGVASQAMQQVTDHGFALGSRVDGRRKTVWLELDLGFTFTEMQGSWVAYATDPSRHHDDSVTSATWYVSDANTSTGLLQFGTPSRVIRQGGHSGVNWNGGGKQLHYTFDQAALSDSVVRFSVVDQSNDEYVDFRDIVIRVR